MFNGASSLVDNAVVKMHATLNCELFDDVAAPRRLHISVRYSFDLIECDLIAAPVIEAGGPSGFMACHLLGDLQLATVLQVGGDSGRAEAVGADSGPQACTSRPLLDHHVNIGLGQGCAIGQPAMAQGRKERGLGFAAEPGCRNPFL